MDQFYPDYAIHPGEILMETLEARNMKKSELAERCGLSPKTVSLILNEKAPITPETAIQLERVLGVSANIWINLYANYRLHTAKATDGDTTMNEKNETVILREKAIYDAQARILSAWGHDALYVKMETNRILRIQRELGVLPSHCEESN